MKMTILTLFVLAGLATADSEKGMNCSYVRNGKFALDDGRGGICIVERKDSLQTEVSKDLDAEGVFRVKWLDDCTYTITPIHYTIGGVEQTEVYNTTCTVNIIKVRPDAYDQVTTSADWDGELKTTMYFTK